MFFNKISVNSVQIIFIFFSQILKQCIELNKKRLNVYCIFVILIIEYQFMAEKVVNSTT